MLPFGIGFSEVVMILLVALIVVGPNKLPEFIRFITRGFKMLNQMVDELKNSAEMHEIKREIYQPLKTMKTEVQDVIDLSKKTMDPRSYDLLGEDKNRKTAQDFDTASPDLGQGSPDADPSLDGALSLPFDTETVDEQDHGPADEQDHGSADKQDHGSADKQDHELSDDEFIIVSRDPQLPIFDRGGETEEGSGQQNEVELDGVKLERKDEENFN